MPALPVDPQINKILDSIRRIVRALRQSSREAETDLGLSGAQLFVIQKLAAAAEPLSVSELASRTLTHPSSVSVVVNRLVERGFALRSPAATDKRRMEVSLAPKGRKFLNGASFVTAQERMTRALSRLPAERQALLADLLAEVILNAGFSGEEASMFFEERAFNAGESI